jgi:adenylate cyclase
MGRAEGARESALAGMAVVALVVALFALNPAGLAFSLREAVFDRLAGAFPRQGPDMQVLMVDIDRASLEKLGAWPWPRARIAALIEKAAEAKPRAIAVDVLLEGEDRNGPRAAMTRIARETGRPDVAALAAEVPDDDAALNDSLDNGTPVVLGLGIQPEARRDVATFPPLVLATVSEAPLDLAPVRVEALTGPAAAMADAAAGLGVLSLDTDIDGRLRRVPLLLDVGGRGGAGQTFAGFALETVRVLEGAGTVIVDPAARRLEIGTAQIAIERDALMRLYPRAPSYWQSHVRPAHAVLAQGLGKLGENTVVLIGASAPEAGAYLPGAITGAVSTLQVQAEAVDQLRSGIALKRVPFAPWSELAAALIAGLIAALAAARLSPLRASVVGAGLVAVVAIASFLLFREALLLADAMPAVFAVLGGAGAASIAAHNRMRSNRALVEARFARYLAPAVVEMLAREPHRLRIEGERREVTALFTDLEGFTSFGERTAPEPFIETLNDYFEMIAKIAVEHGGMVDKIVGDAVHVFFNMPLDQPDHAQRAVDCARAIHKATTAYQNEERQKALGFGRTRIGVDTGQATVGDVGGPGKLDYTAHGEAVNRAARLQNLARDISSGVLIGQGTVRRLVSRDGLVSAGKVTPRGQSEEHEVFTFA